MRKKSGTTTQAKRTHRAKPLGVAKDAVKRERQKNGSLIGAVFEFDSQLAMARLMFQFSPLTMTAAGPID